MPCNMSRIDRRVRGLCIAPLLVVAGVLAGPAGVAAIVLYALAAVMLATAAVGYCPLYPFMHIDTRKLHRHTP